MSEILLTGDRGYLGSTIAAALAGAGQSFAPLTQRLETLAANSLRAALVIHCAGALTHRPQDWENTNAAGTAKLLAALPREARIIFVSSRSVYSGLGVAPLRESDPSEPAGGYGKSKLAAEHAILASGRPHLILRASTLFGLAANGDLGKFNFPAQALRAVAQGEALTLFQPDRQTDYLDVQALAQGIVKLLDPKGGWNRIYNVAGPARSLHDLIRNLVLCAAEAGWPAPRLQFSPGPPPRGPVLDTGLWDADYGPLPVRPDSEIGREIVTAIASFSAH